MTTARGGGPGRGERWGGAGWSLGVAVAALLGGWAPPAEAVTFYVRQSGNDARDGRGPNAAFATIARAASKAGGGDTVVVGPGRYAEGDIVPVGNGRKKEPMRFVADTSGSMTGDPAGPVVVDATGFQVGFRISSRPWVSVNGFTVTNAAAEGIAVKSGSQHVVVSNCVVFSNGGRGIWVRDSKNVVLFNNLVYANGGTGIDFGGDDEGSPGGAAINNTVYFNGLDGIRIEGVVPSPRITVVHNVIAQNFQRGLNLKERSAGGFVAQWNLNIDGYGSEATKAAFDTVQSPLLVAPSGSDQILGGTGAGDDDFRLRQTGGGQVEHSGAVDASPMAAKRLGLHRATTSMNGAADAGPVDLGFHYQSTVDYMTGVRGPVTKRVAELRRRAAACERLGRPGGGGTTRCAVDDRYRQRLRRLCGRLVDEACG